MVEPFLGPSILDAVKAGKWEHLFRLSSVALDFFSRGEVSSLAVLQALETLMRAIVEQPQAGDVLETADDQTFGSQMFNPVSASQRSHPPGCPTRDRRTRWLFERRVSIVTLLAYTDPSERPALFHLDENEVSAAVTSAITSARFGEKIAICIHRK